MRMIVVRGSVHVLSAQKWHCSGGNHALACLFLCNEVQVGILVK